MLHWVPKTPLINAAQNAKEEFKKRFLNKHETLLNWKWHLAKEKATKTSQYNLNIKILRFCSKFLIVLIRLQHKVAD